MHTKLKAFERCNIHGVWLNEVTVKINDRSDRRGPGPFSVLDTRRRVSYT